MPKEEIEDDLDDELDLDEEPFPAKRDTRIFNRKKEDDKKNEDFEEDVFV